LNNKLLACERQLHECCVLREKEKKEPEVQDAGERRGLEQAADLVIR
jgi:hypothetical protein